MSVVERPSPKLTGRRSIFDHEHESFRESLRSFLEREVVPHYEEWGRAGAVPREIFRAAAEQGSVGMQVPESLGGIEIDDFRFNAVIGEEAMLAGVTGFGLGLAAHNDICVPLLLDLAGEPARDRWLAGMASGELISAIAVADLGLGADDVPIGGERTADGWALSGGQPCVLNGINADLLIAPARTGNEPEEASLFVLDREALGPHREPSAELIGPRASGMTDLRLEGVEVGRENLLGEEGEGLAYLARQAREAQLSIAVAALAGARAALAWTIEYVHDRRAFGQPIASFQNTRFALADVAAEIEVAQAFVDACVVARNDDRLDPKRAATAKLRCTELYGRAVDCGLQLHGGYGYMLEYPIAHAYADARFFRLFGGSSEAMKKIVAGSIGL